MEVNSPQDADYVIVNTCGFIEDAKKESIDKIFEMADILKPNGKLVVSGCLSQRYAEELFDEMPEAACFIGVNQYGSIDEILNSLEENQNRDKETSIFTDSCDLDYLERTVRIHKGVPYTATIKVAEGCDNKCAYCIIPSIRGKYRSKRMEDILEEARELAQEGCKELILIAQDLTYYGRDLYGKYMLPNLLEELVKVDGIRWIRLMYCYDNRITDELIEVMAREEKICNYIDIPIQHGSDKVLKEMLRGTTSKKIRSVIEKLRTAMPDIAIRTSLMVGFPGETEEDFRELLSLVEDVRFSRLGTFKYSREEGTLAGDREDQVSEEDKEFRFDAVMRRQINISLENNQMLIGTIQDVIVDSREEDGSYVGRTRYDAPEIDNSVIFTSERELSLGDIVRVKIEDAFDYDLTGVEVR